MSVRSVNLRSVRRARRVDASFEHTSIMMSTGVTYVISLKDRCLRVKYHDYIQTIKCMILYDIHCTCVVTSKYITEEVVKRDYVDRRMKIGIIGSDLVSFFIFYEYDDESLTTCDTSKHVLNLTNYTKHESPEAAHYISVHSWRRI